MGHDRWQEANPPPLAQANHCAMAGTPLTGSEIDITGSTGRCLDLFLGLFVSSRRCFLLFVS